MGILVPPGVEFSMKNTGDVDLTMYIINELVPADFKPGTKVLVRDENLQPVRGTTGHWVHIVKNIFTPADGLATLRQTITVTLDPMTVGEPHAHTVGSEEVWIQIKGKSLAFIGTQLRWQTPGVGYLAPPFAEMTQANVTERSVVSALQHQRWNRAGEISLLPDGEKTHSLAEHVQRGSRIAQDIVDLDVLRDHLAASRWPADFHARDGGIVSPVRNTRAGNSATDTRSCRRVAWCRCRVPFRP